MDDYRFRGARVAVVGGLIAGIALSPHLWLTRLGYPQAPFLGILPPLPFHFDELLLLLFCAGAVSSIVAGRRFIKPTLAIALFLVLQDQSRLQPWFYEYLLLLAALSLTGGEDEALDRCRLILAAVYLWSGIHKMNDSFTYALFPWLVSPFPKEIAQSFEKGATVVPFLEALIGVGLLFPRTRKAAAASAVGMHAFLLGVLGPWALNWNSVVWPWNVVMMGLVPLCFWNCETRAAKLFVPVRLGARTIFALVVVLPATSLFGLWDTNPSFALYAGNALTGTVVISKRVWERLDDETKRVAEDFGSAGYRLHLGKWSMETLNVPPYPTERVLRRVARSFCPISERDADLSFLLVKPTRWPYRDGYRRVESRTELCP